METQEKLARSETSSKSNIIEAAPKTRRFEQSRSQPVPSADDLCLCESVRFLPQFGVPKRMLARATKLAASHNTTAAEELIAFNGMTEEAYYRLLAQHLGVVFAYGHQITELVLRDRNAKIALHPNATVWGSIDGGKICVITAPSPRSIPALEKLARNGDPRKIVIVPPRELRNRIAEELSDELLEKSVNHLSIAQPLSSARFGATAWQGALLVIFIFAAIGFMFLAASVSTFALHVSLSLFFFACAALRLVATVQYEHQPNASFKHYSDAEKPVYSVMVALHDEAAIVPDLVASMAKLKWPRSKLEIKLVCEADDHDTLEALEGVELDSRFDIICVPPSEPRTKPKALDYAMAFTTGPFVTLYDAEDRPHPEQLMEAYSKFSDCGDEIACLQAPLEGANYKRNFWTGLFYFEYAGLFRGLTPWLAKRKAPVLLGGTSNHFRRDALLKVGLWDPYNVTEDADLGLRLWRHGFRTDIITRSTLEDAPHSFAIWLPQRTRWFKGWMQTWIVQMRQPAQLRANMSWSSFLVMQILLTGTIVSALVHPLVFSKAVYLSYWVSTNVTQDIWITRIAILDWVTIFCSYIGFVALAWRASDKKQRKAIGWKTLLTPLYWLAISVAAWRALYQLLVKPFYWEKTPHTPHEK